MTMSKKTARSLRPIAAHELARVHGGGILLLTLGQPKEPASSQVMVEELSINFEKLEPGR
jgi:hypothetical protein